MITVMLSFLLSGPGIIKLSGFFVLYDFSFKWFPTPWKRWLFWAGLMVVIPMIGVSAPPERFGQLSAGYLGWLMLVQLIRWTYIKITHSHRG